MSGPGLDIPELDRRGLREFGLLMAAVIGALFGLLLPWLLGLAFAVPALVAPPTLKPVYRGWMRFGFFMSRIMTPLILGIVFFCVFTPVALFLKLVGRDAMRRKLDTSAESYRIDSRDSEMGDMERPF